MKIIDPIVVTTAMLISSTAPENDYAAWNAVTPYVVGDKRILASTHRVYQCLVNNTGYSPDVNLTGAAPKWKDIAPTNSWAMFDNVVGTSTTLASTLTTVLTPGSVSGVYLSDLVGKEVVVSMKSAVSGPSVYSKTINLDGTIITSIYDWFFQPRMQMTSVVLTDLPFHYFAPELTVSISGGTEVACGACKFGEMIDIGNTELGVTSGIIDYSIKSTDEFGNYFFLERPFSRRASFSVETIGADHHRISTILARLRGRLCVYIGSEVAGYESLVMYGKYNDFSIVVTHGTINYCSLEVEGLAQK